MRTQIIGLGTVGRAQAHLLHKLNHEVHAYDVQAKKPPKYVNFITKPHSNVNINFICTPEAQVENAIQNLVRNHVQGLYVVKSSTPPGTTKLLSEKYHVHICHNPEFLRKKYAFQDVENPSRIIIGQCCPKHGRLLAGLYKPLNKPIYVTEPTISELVKLTGNALRATVITFWNEIHELAAALRLNTREVADLVDQVQTIGTWEGGQWGTRFFGKSYGGCLPKDVDQLINIFQQHGLSPTLFQAIKIFNEKL